MPDVAFLVLVRKLGVDTATLPFFRSCFVDGTARNRLLATFFYAPASGDFSRFVYRGFTASRHRSIQEAHELLRLVRGACEANGLTFRFFFLPFTSFTLNRRFSGFWSNTPSFVSLFR